MESSVFIFLGRSGSGKGTQAELLVNHLKSSGRGCYYLSSGSLFRELSSRPSDTGIRVGEAVRNGHLPEEEIAMGLVIQAIAYNLMPDQRLVLDGAPREIAQAEHLDKLFKFLERFNKTKVLLLDISRDEAMKRLKLRDRADDTEEAINNRLDFFDQKVAPVVSHYESLGMLVRIDGEQSVEAIFEDIKKELEL